MYQVDLCATILLLCNAPTRDMFSIGMCFGLTAYPISIHASLEDRFSTYVGRKSAKREELL